MLRRFILLILNGHVFGYISFPPIFFFLFPFCVFLKNSCNLSAKLFIFILIFKKILRFQLSSLFKWRRWNNDRKSIYWEINFQLSFLSPTQFVLFPSLFTSWIFTLIIMENGDGGLVVRICRISLISIYELGFLIILCIISKTKYLNLYHSYIQRKFTSLSYIR